MTHTDTVEKSILQMQESLQQLLNQHTNESWYQQGNIKIAELCNGDKEVVFFAEELILFISDYLTCLGGTFYTNGANGKLDLIYSLGLNSEIPREIDAKQSYLRQAIKKKSHVIFQNLTSTYFNIQASLLNVSSGSFIIIPLFYNDFFVGIIELAKPGIFSTNEILFLEECSKSISIFLNTLLAKKKLKDLLITLDSKEQELQNTISAINKATLMIEFDPDGQILEANNLFLDLTKYSKEEVFGKHHKLLCADKERYEEEYGDFWVALKQGLNHRGEYKRQCKDGTTIWIQASYSPVSDNSGRVYKIIKIGYDITLLKNQQTKIEEISLNLKQQIEVLNKAAIVSETDAEGNILYVNDLFCEISEYNREELIGQNHRMLKSGKQPDGIFVGLWKAIKMGRTWKGEILNKSKNGNFYWVESTITPFKNQAGEIEKIVAIRFDITKQKESEALKRQTEALLQAQRELEESNAELEAQTQKLQASEEELRVQQEELMQSNKELEEKRILVEEKNYSFSLKNKELMEATELIRKKSEELELSSKYKSEFLANMSHELRTPLNSIILLSKLMSDNLDKNLSDDQIEYISVVNKAGINLIDLINDILDLSKIESGKMDINPEFINLHQFKKDIEGLFNPLSKDKEIDFSVEIEEDGLGNFFSDRLRIEQVVKNFLSNAFKFTAKGKVRLAIFGSGIDMISFSVIDNGIGIPKDKQALVFEAFQQADGSTKRKYGGTGLGLSISREIANLLGGNISLESEPDKGSTFTLTVPSNYSETIITKITELSSDIDFQKPGSENEVSSTKPPVTEVNIEDDRKSINNGDKTILIVEDDVYLAKAFLKESHTNGFKVLVAMNGNDAVILAKKYLPSGIILDINLPIKNGWEVLREVKDFAETRKIPVHIVSALDIEKSIGIEAGAESVSTKPITSDAMQKILHSLNHNSARNAGKIFLLSDKEEHQVAMKDFLDEAGVNIDILRVDISLIGQLANQDISVLILDISSRKIKINEILESLKADYTGKQLTIIILASAYLSKMEQRRIETYKDTFDLKIVKSYSDIAEETKLFFNFIVKTDKQKKPRLFVNTSKIIEGRKILVVDDDEQNLFSIKKLLERHKAIVIMARNGKEAVDLFVKDSGIDLILMDVIMPVMDGYEAIGKIREMQGGKEIPIITLTAKNQPDERVKSLTNGSSDFISKPLDADQLVGLMKVWLSNASK